MQGRLPAFLKEKGGPKRRIQAKAASNGTQATRKRRLSFHLVTSPSPSRLTCNSDTAQLALGAFT